MSSKKQQDDARSVALRIIARVLEHGESLGTAMPYAMRDLDERERPMVQALVYGVLRWRWRIEYILKKFLKKPLKAKDLDVQIILMLGVYQLLWMRTPDYAAVDAAVKNSTKIKKKWATGLINAILRQLIREQDQFQYQANLMAEFSHPQWLIERIKKDWPEHWQAILTAANEAAPMTIRIDTRQTTVTDYLAALEQVEITATPSPVVATALVLEQAVDVYRLPGFEEGKVSVQDAAAQLAAQLLQLEPRQKVLDACAAPGGKTAHLLQLEPTLHVDAVDISEKRLERVEENLERLTLQANLMAADISEPADWWNGECYDRILLDAPCSATGVIRRHPDIKSLRRPTDIPELAETQKKILDAVWPMLKPGGLMLYATCSVLKAENELQMQAFLQRTADAREIKIDADWGHEQLVGRQVLSGEQQMDGFYYALIRKAD